MLADAALDTITNTTSALALGFDNGPLTFASPNVSSGTVTAGGSITQPAANGTSAYTVTCSASSGTFTTGVTPLSPTGSGDITSAELIARTQLIHRRIEVVLIGTGNVEFLAQGRTIAIRAPQERGAVLAVFDALDDRDDMSSTATLRHLRPILESRRRNIKRFLTTFRSKRNERKPCIIRLSGNHRATLNGEVPTKPEFPDSGGKKALNIKLFGAFFVADC